MAKAKTLDAIDTTPGARAYALAQQYKAELEPRLPAGLVADLARDLATLGADPHAPAPGGATGPSLAQALSVATALITAVHEAVLGAKAKGEVRKAYGASGKGAGAEVSDVLASGAKIVARAQENPSEALGLGILPADVTALAEALGALRGAETAAKGRPVASAKEQKAAAARVAEAVGRIAGAGALAFARDEAVRAEFRALQEK